MTHQVPFQDAQGDTMSVQSLGGGDYRVNGVVRRSAITGRYVTTNQKTGSGPSPATNGTRDQGSGAEAAKSR